MASDSLNRPWLASNYLDTDECGVLTEDNVIVIGISVGLTRQQCERIAEWHNKQL